MSRARNRRTEAQETERLRRRRKVARRKGRPVESRPLVAFRESRPVEIVQAPEPRRSLFRRILGLR